MSKRDAETTRMWQLAGQYSAIGIEMVISVGVGALGGSWLDARYGLTPWMTTLGLVVGIGAAGLTVQRLIVQSKRILRQNTPPEPAPVPPKDP